MLWNRALPIDGVDHVIVGRAPGFDDWQATVQVPVEGGNVTVQVPAMKEHGKLSSAARSSSSSPPSSSRPSPAS